MKFKMAHGSLFAVLMRSTWWYSALIALFPIAMGFVAFEGQYLIIGISASLPFLGIAAYSAYKQAKRPAMKRVLEVQKAALKMPVAELAKTIAAHYEKNNFSVVAFKGDEAELELERSRHKYLLSCKRFKAANTGIEPLKKLTAAGEKHEATGYLYVALGEISASALEYAQKNKIELIQAEALTEYFDGTKDLL